MRKKIHSIRDFITPIIDFFYPPFRRLMDIQTFRYAVSGSINTVTGLIVYYVSFKYIFREKTFHFGFYAFKAHIAALFTSFCVSLPVGFFLSKYVVFSESNMKGRIQLFRYFMVCVFSLMLNYILLKIFVERLQIYPTIAQLLTIVIVVLFSYLSQKYFSFRVKSAPADSTD